MLSEFDPDDFDNDDDKVSKVQKTIEGQGHVADNFSTLTSWQKSNFPVIKNNKLIEV